MSLFIGLSQWSHPAWPGQLLRRSLKTTEHLIDYAQVFNSVEGNTSLYGVPTTASLVRWNEQTPKHFKFTLKFPASISHQGLLADKLSETQSFIEHLAPLRAKLGMLLLQLPARSGPEQLPGLAKLLDALPSDLTCGVEVRHPAFFAKGDVERDLNRLLITHNANRIIMDSRAVFSAPPSTPALADAQQKKPNVPVHIISTGNAPMIRFIGHPDPDYNRPYWQPWIPRINHWLSEGKSVYVFIHTADNQQAPQLAADIASALHQPLLSFPGLAPHPQGQLF